MRSRPRRPFPSRKGWIVSNCTCASAALMSGGVGSGSSLRKRSKRLQTLGEAVGRRRHEGGVARSRAADPHLGAADLARRLAAPAGMRHQHLVHPAQEPHRERQPTAERREPVLERGDAAADLARVFHRHARLLVDLEEQQVGQRRLRAFDLRRQHRLLAHEAVEQQRRVRQVRRKRVEPAEREQCIVESASKRGRPVDRRLGRQRRRDEGTESLTGCCHLDVRSGRASPHEGGNLKQGQGVILVY